jgi:hypothetical protein
MLVSVKCRHCGKEYDLYPSDIRQGKGKHCSRECRKASGSHRQYAATHGMSRTRLYQIWSDMKNRCYCEQNAGFEYYGGRGIKVCDEWRESFETFRDWALASGYSDDLELDRRDADVGYEPGNCRWATRVQQMRNTRKRKDAQTSRYKGVSRHSQNGRWVAQIVSPGRPAYIGLFDSETDAARAYDAKARELYGEFAHTNFKD